MIILSFLFLTLITLVTLYFLFLTIVNTITYKKNNRKYSLKNSVPVDVLIPARNEEKNIENCLSTILNQDYSNYRVFVIDDHSEDKTWELMQKYKDYENVTLVQSVSLPEGWKGKQNALNQIFNISNSEIVICTDADMQFEPSFVRYVVERMECLNVDMISGWPKQIVKNKNSLFLLPIGYLVTFFILPIFLINKAKNYRLSFAIGQFIAYKRESFLKTGGYESIKNQINEDIFTARLLKKNNLKIAFLDAKDQIKGEWFPDFKSGKKGFERSLINFFNNRTFIFLCANFFIFLYFICFPLAVINSQIVFDFDRYILLTIYIIFLSTWIYAILNRGFEFNWRFCFPIVSFATLSWIFITAIDKKIKGVGYYWKGRNVQ